MKRLILICVFLCLQCSSLAWADLRTGLKALELDDYATALKELQPLSEQGNPEAQFWLGQMYRFGWGVKKDETEAARWWLKAAEQGHTRAQKMMVHAYEEGAGVKKDPAEAKKWQYKSQSSTRLAGKVYGPSCFIANLDAVIESCQDVFPGHALPIRSAYQQWNITNKDLLKIYRSHQGQAKVKACRKAVFKGYGEEWKKKVCTGIEKRLFSISGLKLQDGLQEEQEVLSKTIEEFEEEGKDEYPACFWQAISDVLMLEKGDVDPFCLIKLEK